MTDDSQFASKKFQSYRQKYSPRPANLTNQQHQDELVNYCGKGDVSSLMIPPADTVLISTAPNSADTKYLWLVGVDDVPIGPESGTTGKATTRGRLAHTNLSGGAPAHAGGELWFRDKGAVWLNGGSSRYQASSVVELDAIAEAFVASGYSVCSCGWDEELGMPARLFRGKEVWR